MAEYIDRQSVLSAYQKEQCKNGAWRFEALINSIPAADVAPVVHARWIRLNLNNDGEQIIKCSACGYPTSYFWGKTPYCHNCGAKMDLEESK